MGTLRKNNSFGVSENVVSLLVVTASLIQYTETARVMLTRTPNDTERSLLGKEFAMFFDTAATYFSLWHSLSKKERTNSIIAMIALIQWAETAYMVTNKLMVGEKAFPANMDFLVLICDTAMTAYLAGPPLLRLAEKATSYFKPDSTVRTMFNKCVETAGNCVTQAKDAVVRRLPGMRQGG